MSLRKRIVFGCLFGGVAVAPGVVHAQFLDLTVRSSHSAYPAGAPQRFTSTAATQPNGQPTAFNGAAVTNYSLEGVFASGAPANGVALPDGESIAAFLAENPGVRLIPGDAARSGELRINVPAPGEAGQAVATLDGTISLFGGDCRYNRGFNARVGLPANTTVGVCDALDATLRMNGVSFQLSADQDQVPYTLRIPEVNYAFTAAPAPLATAVDPFIRRSDSLSALTDNFFASGKAPAVAALLMGRSADFVPPRNVLPTDGKLLTGSLTTGGVTKTFGFDNPGQVVAFLIVNRESELPDFGLPYSGDCRRSAAAGAVSGSCSAGSVVLRVAGLELTATTNANSPDVTFSAPDLNLSFTSSGALNREDATAQFIDYASENVASEDLTRAYARYRAATDPTDPLVGNPYSAQGQLNRASLDLDSPSEALDENRDAKGQRTRADDPSGWMIGGRAGYLSAGNAGAEFVDANIERGFRIQEGSRMRLKISMPLSYIHYGGKADGGQTASFGLRGALEAPLIQGRWVIEPSAAVSAFYSDNEVSSGALYSVGISSRYKIAPIGRGHIVIGNAVNYSSTIEIEAGGFASPKISNTAVRNGVAYQVPYGRFMGRQGTVRASYTYTHLFGDRVLVDDLHEVSLSYGVASREAAVKQVGETLRFGLNGGFGHKFTAVSLTAGYRF